MGPEVPEVDEAPPVVRARARRGVSLIFVSLLVIGLAGLDFVHPSTRAETSPVAVAASATYQLAAVDFVSPDTGWFAATFASGRFALMHTTDAGNHWPRQLSAHVGRAPPSAHFFHSPPALLPVLGTHPLTHR